MCSSTRRAYAPLRELSRRAAKSLSANASNNLACTGASAEPMRLSPYDAPDSVDASRTSGNAAPLAGRLHDRAHFIFLSCTQPLVNRAPMLEAVRGEGDALDVLHD